MDGSEEIGAREELPDGAAELVDLAAKWMRRAGLIGPIEKAAIEFTFDEHGRVNGFFAKTRGGRRQLEPAPA